MPPPSYRQQRVAKGPRKVIPRITAALAIAVALSSPAHALTPDVGDGQPTRVVVFGIPGVVWKDIQGADMPNLEHLISLGAVGNVSVRISNRASEGYGNLGAGKRVQADGTGGWAFGPQEIIENGSASALYVRRSGLAPHGQVLNAGIAWMARRNTRKAFDATPGLLGQSISEVGGKTCVLGNADQGIGPLPRRLPSFAVMSGDSILDPGIHREAVLAAMTRDGTVPAGVVDRSLLETNPSSPFGIRTSLAAVETALDLLGDSCALTVIESGDTYRADSYSLGLAKDEAADVRRHGLESADALLGVVLRQLDLERTLVIVVAPTTPGGPTTRGQLRPAVVAGNGMRHGTLTSDSTRRAGLVTMSDLSSTIAKRTVGDREMPRFEGGHQVLAKGRSDVSALVEMNDRTVLHDALRTPIAISVVSGTLIVYLLALWRVRRVPLWLEVLLLASLAFPLASYIPRMGLWRAGGLVSAASVVGGALIIAALARLIERATRLWSAGIVVAATTAFFVVDLLRGAPMQWDSIFGYTSVAAGRFFGLGNLGYALLAGGAFLTAGWIADRGSKASRYLSFAIIAVVILVIGYPTLGDDVGGTLSMVPAAAVFVVGVISARRIKLKHWPLLVLGSIALVLVFGAIDLARPPSARSHLANFLTQVAADPSSIWLTFRRKITLAVVLAVASRWGLAAPGATGALIALHLRSRGGWRQIMDSRPALKAGLEALFVAAIAGSLLNDSGVAIAGTMLSLAAPWALLVASRYGVFETASATSPT